MESLLNATYLGWTPESTAAYETCADLLHSLGRQLVALA